LLSKLRTRLTYANVMATIAVFVALGGQLLRRNHHHGQERQELVPYGQGHQELLAHDLRREEPLAAGG
jgi:hypothetical protein